MNEETPSYSYDKIPYKSFPFMQTHPDRLFTTGLLFGLTGAPITHCRVLELGCASGGNLLPMACNLPESTFIGVDLSKVQVEMGKKAINNLELKNVTIVHDSLVNIDSSWGSFDYIICHGIYSWVPDAIKEKILSISANNLKPDGIAYVSYNTYPGWHMREMIRHMMLYHSSRFTETKERIEQARAVIAFLSSAIPTKNSHYGILLKNELDLIQRCSDSYLFHDHMEEINAPIYFHQFIERADLHGLQYLGEAEFSTMVAGNFPADIADTLTKISQDIINTEQYMDFLRNRQFRQTLLCHKERKLRRDLNGKHIEGLLVASPLRPVKEPVDYSDEKIQVFQTPAGVSIETKYPLTKAALMVLRDIWPRAVNFETLYTDASQILDALPLSGESESQKSRQVLADDLLFCSTANTIEFHSWQAHFVTKVSVRPKVSKLALYQSKHNPFVVNQRHENVNLDPVSQHLLPLLDGSRDHAALVQQLEERVTDGSMVLRKNDAPLTDPKTIRITLEMAVEQSLDELACSALLVE